MGSPLASPGPGAASSLLNKIRLIRATLLADGGRFCSARGWRGLAEERFEKAFSIFKKLGNKRGQAYALRGLGIIYRQRGELEKAEEHDKKSLALEEEIGNRQGQAHQLSELGWIYLRRRELDKAEEYHNKALAIHQEIANKAGRAYALDGIGWVCYARSLFHLERQDVKEALEHMCRARDLFAEAGDRPDVKKAKALIAELEEELRGGGAQRS